MFSKRQWYFSILLMSLPWISAVAQNQTSTGAQNSAPEFNIIIDRKSVRFSSPTQVHEWRVEVYSETGELVFSTGTQSTSELEWPLLDQSGKPVESGLYAYALTIKEQAREGTRVQRGHVIVDRASAADRVWVTSDRAAGIGTGGEKSKLTVAGTSETTVGGAEVSEAAEKSTTNTARGPEEVRRSAAAAAADGTGTTGRIAKWIGGTTLGNSAITESYGRIGIGTTLPTAPLHIEGGADLQLRLVDRKASGRSWAFGTGHNNPGDFVFLDVTDNANVWRVLPGNKGAFLIQNRNVGIEGNVDISSNLSVAGNADISLNLGIGTNTPQERLDVAGTTRTRALQITGGADLAEPFEVSGAEAVKPGLVVAIDPKHPGRLRLADKAYDRTVAGVVSGANGINPGLTMKQEGTLADGSLPVSLTGRVYCWVDALYGAIKPGDLLTTSKTPGHAMKVTKHLKAGGAIIGKAMTGLNSGKGLVLVLVTLQ